MRGGRTFRNTPRWMLLFVLLLAACNLDLKLSEPYLEIEAHAGYNTPNEVMLRFKFSADEPVLRCRYVMSKSGQEIAARPTGPLAAGVWHEQSLDISATGDGQYSFRLIVQAERSGQFVDLAFLDKSVDFFLDTAAPADPEIDLPNGQRYTQQQSIQPSHPEWTAPTVPEGSPVTIYYTTDGTDPRTSVSRLSSTGSAIPLPFDRGIVPFKAVAEDAAGNQSGGIIARDYRFMHIVSTNPVSSTQDYIDIQVNGFGFSLVNLAGITMKDTDGTSVVIPYNPNVVDTTVTFPAHLDYAGIDVGTSIITFSYYDPGSVADAVTFEITN
jgi:hypothetical protein